MIVDVQKPIQSLHSFGRHYSGGSIAALPDTDGPSGHGPEERTLP